MLRNVVNRHDLAALVDLPRLRRVAARATRSHATRVGGHFSGQKSRPLWVSNPIVQARINQRVTGDPNVGFPEYAVAKYLTGRTDLRAVALGCGNGRNVMRWGATGAFSRIEGYDLSKDRIDNARAAAERKGLADVMRFEVADAYSVDLEAKAYDVAIAEQAIHHFKPLRDILERFVTCLRGDGFLFVDEFVGPRRFQWTPRQIEAANGLLATFPERYRIQATDGQVKRAIENSSILRMWLRDPSEAIESDLIEPLLAELFVVEARLPYGGTLSSPVLGNVVHNFSGDDPEAVALLDRCFAIEDALIADGELENDFVAFVCRPGRS